MKILKVSVGYSSIETPERIIKRTNKVCSVTVTIVILCVCLSKTLLCTLFVTSKQYLFRILISDKWLLIFYDKLPALMSMSAMTGLFPATEPCSGVSSVFVTR